MTNVYFQHYIQVNSRDDECPFISEDTLTWVLKTFQEESGFINKLGIKTSALAIESIMLF